MFPARPGAARRPTRAARRFTGPAALAVLAALAALGACADPVAPAQRAAPAAVRAAKSGAERVQLTSNRTKYRNRGAQPASANFGSGEVSAQSVVDRAGRTYVRIASIPGQLAKVQLKAFAPGGRLLGTQNYNNIATEVLALTLAGPGRGAPLGVEAQTRDPAKGGGTGVVQLTDTVRLAPDLHAAVQAPSRAALGAPVYVMASVAERNGEVGARATCVLRADGVAVDSATNVWVDAGDEVGCSFTYVPRGLGLHRLRVEVTGAAPAEYDERDNAAEATIEAVDPGTLVVPATGMAYLAYVHQLTGVDSLRSASRARYGDTKTEEVRTLEDVTVYHHTQSLRLDFYAPHGAPESATALALRVTAGGVTLDSASSVPVGDLLARDWSTGCGVARRPGGYLRLCTRTTGVGAEDRYTGYVAGTYVRRAEHVDYQSAWTHRLYFADGTSEAGPLDGYGYVSTSDDGSAPIAADAGAVTFDLALTVAGLHRYAAYAVVPVAPESADYVSPYSCGAEYYSPWTNTTYISCFGLTTRGTRLRGEAAFPAGWAPRWMPEPRI